MTSNEQVTSGLSTAFSICGQRTVLQSQQIQLVAQEWHTFRTLANTLPNNDPFQTSSKQTQLPFRPPSTRTENKENKLPPGKSQQLVKQVLVEKTVGLLQGQQQSRVSEGSGQKNKVSFQLQSFNSMRLGPKPLFRLEPRRQRRVLSLSGTGPTDVSVHVQGLKINVKITPH